MKILLFFLGLLASTLQAQVLIFKCTKVQDITHPIMSTREALEKGLVEYLDGGTCLSYYIIDLDEPSIVFIDSSKAYKYKGKETFRVYEVSLNTDTAIDVWADVNHGDNFHNNVSFYYEKNRNILIVREVYKGKIIGFFIPDVEVSVHRKKDKKSVGLR